MTKGKFFFRNFLHHILLQRKRNKKNIFITVLVGFVFVFIVLLLIDTSYIKGFLPSKNYVITLSQNQFRPDYLVIHQYDTVTFINATSRDFWPASNLHPSHKLYSAFDPKRAFSPGKSWTFKFDKTGIHQFHDHLAPDVVGTIVVLDEKGRAADINCSSDIQSEKCWNDQITTTIKKSGIAAGFDLFLSLFHKYKAFQDDCHTFSHTLGHEAYTVFYKTKQKIPMSPVLSYCGYGFYHGFLESLTIQTNDPGKIREFCDSLKDNGKKGRDYYQCYHGIGHGNLNKHTDIKSEKLQNVINESLRLCERINTSELELKNCVAGVYGPTYNYFPQESKANKALADKQGIISVCYNQPEKYKEWCYDALSRFLLPTNHNDFLQAVSLIRNVGNLKHEKISVYQSAVYLARIRKGIKTNFDGEIKTCLTLEEKYQKECITGFVGGLLYDLDEHKLNQGAINFCNNTLIPLPLQISCKEQLANRTY